MRTYDDNPFYKNYRSSYNVRELRRLRILGLGGNEQGSEHKDGGRQKLDHHVKRRPRRVLEGIPDGVAGDSRLVRVAALSSEVPQLSEGLRESRTVVVGVSFDAATIMRA